MFIKVAELYKVILLAAMVFVVFAFHAITAILLIGLHVVVDQLLFECFHLHVCLLRKPKKESMQDSNWKKQCASDQESPHCL
jgi:hypothetical protein